MGIAILANPTYRRLGLYFLILLALSLISMVVFVLATDRPLPSEEELFPEPVILNPEKRPSFVFPVAARTYDLSQNRFVDRFARVCMEGKYSEFRLLLSRHQPPMLPPRFESNFNALKQIRIQSIEKLPPVKDVEGPVYLMTAEYSLEEYAVRRGEAVKRAQVAIAREDGEWRLGPIPSDSMDLLRAYRASQEAERQGEVPDASDVAVKPPTRPSANRPASLDDGL
jgi:hypothetical protein